MEPYNIFTITAAILGSLGGGAVIVVAFSHWLGSVWAKRIIQTEKNKLDILLENHRNVMKKSEMLFEKELQASIELSKIVYDITGSHLPADKVDDNLSAGILNSKATICNKIRIFITLYRVVINDDILNELCECIDLANRKCNSDKTDIYCDKELAKMLYNQLFNAERNLVNQVRKQYLA